MSYQQIKDLRPALFKRYCEVKPDTFHKMVAVIAVCAVLCGAESWAEIAEFGRAKRAWFATLLELPGGLPWHDPFRRIFLLLDPHESERTFLEWVRAAVRPPKGRLIKVEGKELRGPGPAPVAGKVGGRRVSAWAAEHTAVLGKLRRRKKPMQSRRFRLCSRA